MTNTFIHWRSFEVLRGDAAGRPLVALRMTDANNASVFPLTLDEAIELGQCLTSAAAVLYRG